MSRPGDWNCRSCQHLNFQRRDSCQRCREPKPVESGDHCGSFVVPGPDVRAGDWYCTCGAHNYASRLSCFKCGASKNDSSGGSASDMSRMRGFEFGVGGSNISRSGWKSGDWICSRAGCNEHNFASRTECYRCNAPRDLSSSKASR
ncbi:zinc finger Ran-binding domain-containing protein 2 [Manihot esculenta]|uniref:RanBP2-type domain-containing protein n=1 Tax=Manihot esculenta TaxID=3983 RepID=A0A2C9W548_MANES|nr:zinc finger Ran-binding domain-containing protein 2 [Manihot esculenta]OAY53699.1 hypothetical protein MANES_03G017100v8 [Manihot esculenta]